MTVTINRKTGWSGSNSTISIKLNGEKVKKIKHNQEVNLAIQNDSAHLKGGGFGAKSNKIEVKDGDVVEITTTKWGYISYYFYLVFLIIMFFIIEVYSELLIIIPTLLFISFLLINTYHLNILDDKS
jgi:hypothetical protein